MEQFQLFLRQDFASWPKKKIKMGTESWTVTNEKCRPEVGVELCDQCRREGLKHVFLCVKEAEMCLYGFPCHQDGDTCVSPRANNKTFQSHAEASACLVYSGFLHVSAPV